MTDINELIKKKRVEIEEQTKNKVRFKIDNTFARVREVHWYNPYMKVIYIVAFILSFILIFLFIYYDSFFDFILNILSEIIGILITVLIIDNLIRKYQYKRILPLKKLVYELIAKSIWSLHEETEIHQFAIRDADDFADKKRISEITIHRLKSEIISILSLVERNQDVIEPDLKTEIQKFDDVTKKEIENYDIFKETLSEQAYINLINEVINVIFKNSYNMIVPLINSNSLTAELLEKMEYLHNNWKRIKNIY